jgi:hypothetical protein
MRPPPPISGRHRSRPELERGPGRRRLRPFILAQDYPALEVLVVDNCQHRRVGRPRASRVSPGPPSRQRAEPGFGGGNNAGLNRTTTPYVLMCNNVRASPRTASAGWSRARSRPARRIGHADDHPCKSGLVDATGIVVCPDGLALGRGRASGPRTSPNRPRSSMRPTASASTAAP